MYSVDKAGAQNDNSHCKLLDYRHGSTARPRMLVRPAVDNSRPQIGLIRRYGFTPLNGYVSTMSLMDSALARVKVST